MMAKTSADDGRRSTQGLPNVCYKTGCLHLIEDRRLILSPDRNLSWSGTRWFDSEVDSPIAVWMNEERGWKILAVQGLQQHQDDHRAWLASILRQRPRFLVEYELKWCSLLTDTQNSSFMKRKRVIESQWKKLGRSSIGVVAAAEPIVLKSCNLDDECIWGNMML